MYFLESSEYDITVVGLVSFLLHHMQAFWCLKYEKSETIYISVPTPNSGGLLLPIPL